MKNVQSSIDDPRASWGEMAEKILMVQEMGGPDEKYDFKGNFNEIIQGGKLNIHTMP
jgi:hypothetical protein